MLARFRQNCGGPVPGLSRVLGGGVRVQQSRVVLAPRRWCQAGAKPFRAAMGARMPGSPGRARYKLSNHCAGKAGIVPTIPVVPSPCFSLCTGAAGVADTRPSLRPLQWRGRHKQQLGRDFASRERERSCQRLFEILNQHMFWLASRLAQQSKHASPVGRRWMVRSRPGPARDESPPIHSAYRLIGSAKPGLFVVEMTRPHAARMRTGTDLYDGVPLSLSQ